MSDFSVLTALKEKGHRITTARAAIVQVFSGSDEPFSAADIYAILQKHQLRTNKVTVYREIAFLLAERVIHEVTFNDGVKRYEMTSGDHHHHLICTSCNAVQDVHMNNDLDAVEQLIEKKTSFKVQSHSLEFYGLCAKCA